MSICSRHHPSKPDPNCDLCNTDIRDVLPNYDAMTAQAEAAGLHTCTWPFCKFEFYKTVDSCPKCGMIRKECLVKGHIYRIHSRNLKIGVFDGERGFVGIREKFGDRYLFTEFYSDGGAFGTVKPLLDLGTIPEGMEIKCYARDYDSVTGRDVAFDKPIADGGRGWYFLDTGESSTEIRACCEMYKPLFDFLEKTNGTLP